MKRFYFSFVGLCLVLMTSCQFSENIYLNEDGSGNVKFSVDGTELMMMAGEEIKKENGDKVIDSTIVFKDFLEAKKDSIAQLSQEEQEKLKMLEDYSMHMLMDPVAKAMVFEMSTKFDNADKLKDLFKAMNSFSNFNGEGGASENDATNPFSTIGGDGSTEVSYSYQNNVFKRSGKIVDQELHQQAMDSLGQMAMMFGSSNYKLNYHFPKPVKSVSNEKAMLSQDRKIVTLEVGLMESMRDPALLDLEVTLED